MGKAQVSRAVQAEFSDWIMEVALRIQFSNVVAAIADSYDTAPDILKPEIEKLLTELGETPTSPEPYNNFCKFFNFEDIGIVMNTLYSVMSASGSDVDKELSTIFSQNRKQANTVSEQQRKIKMPGINYTATGKYLPAVHYYLQIWHSMLCILLMVSRL